MLKIGLTGGIGSGKTTVAQIFERLHIPVFYADDESKSILNTNLQLQHKLKAEFGEAVYQNNQLAREKLAAIVFNDKEKLNRLNALVHPAVAERFKTWCEEQKAPYILKEAAILFETNSYKSLDKTILITASKELRIARVMQRNHTSKEEVLARMAKQWHDDKKEALADFVIRNDEKESLIKQILSIHESIINTAG